MHKCTHYKLEISEFKVTCFNIFFCSDEDYEDPIVEEEDPIVEEQPRELLKFDPNDQFETEYYGTDSDDDL